jgi:hypothetical protein
MEPGFVVGVDILEIGKALVEEDGVRREREDGEVLQGFGFDEEDVS